MKMKPNWSDIVNCIFFLKILKKRAIYDSKTKIDYLIFNNSILFFIYKIHSRKYYYQKSATKYFVPSMYSGVTLIFYNCSYNKTQYR